MGNGHSDSPGKSPVFVEAGRKGARRRWGEPRVVRLDDLSGPQRRLVLALVDAAKSETKTATTVSETPVVATEVRCDDTERPSAA